MPKATQPLQEVDRMLMAAVENAVTQAVENAGPELKALNPRLSPREYFMDGVLRQLFLRMCGADLETNEGGDPETAWKILYMGRSVARHWEREHGRPVTIRKKKDRREDIQRDDAERQQLAASAREFAMTTAIRGLLDHARTSDPQITERLEAMIDARHGGLESASDSEREFTARAKSFLSLLTARPEE